MSGIPRRVGISQHDATRLQNLPSDTTPPVGFRCGLRQWGIAMWRHSLRLGESWRSHQVRHERPEGFPFLSPGFCGAVSDCQSQRFFYQRLAGFCIHGSAPKLLSVPSLRRSRFFRLCPLRQPFAASRVMVSAARFPAESSTFSGSAPLRPGVQAAALFGEAAAVTRPVGECRFSLRLQRALFMGR